MLYRFSKEELLIMNLWAQNTVNGGHWGDGQVLLGEEAGLLNKIRNALGAQNPAEEAIELSTLELRVLEFWREDNGKDAEKMTGGNAAVSLARKISDAYRAALVRTVG